MYLTMTIHLWTARLTNLIQRVLGFSFDLSGLSVDPADLELDLDFGRE